MKCRAEISLTFDDEAVAVVAAEALAPDNEGWISQSRDGATVRAAAEAPDPMSLLRTVDDWLAAATVAQKAAKAGR